MSSEATYGQNLVRLNPMDTPPVFEIKKRYSQIIDLLTDARTSMSTGHSETMRHLSIAITEAENACMWAVKAVTAQ